MAPPCLCPLAQLVWGLLNAIPCRLRMSRATPASRFTLGRSRATPASSFGRASIGCTRPGESANKARRKTPGYRPSTNLTDCFPQLDSIPCWMNAASTATIKASLLSLGASTLTISVELVVADSCLPPILRPYFRGNVSLDGPRVRPRRVSSATPTYDSHDWPDLLLRPVAPRPRCLPVFARVTIHVPWDLTGAILIANPES